MNVSGAPQVSSTPPCQKERKLTSTTLSDSSVPGTALACKRGEVRAHQLGAWLPHVESRAYSANRRQATGRNVVGELLSGLGL